LTPSNGGSWSACARRGDQPVAFAELHAGGIDFPAAVVSELELNGSVIERIYDHKAAGARAPAPSKNLPTHPTHPPHTDGVGDPGADR
jgi:hypothetical protein